jgi:hypothetical protein
MHAEHADSNGLNDLSGHVLATRSPCSMRWGSDSWQRSMRTRWHMNCAGACLGEGWGPIGCATLWRQGALQRRGGRRVSRGRQATPNHLRVPRASALICVKTLLASAMPQSSQRGPRPYAIATSPSYGRDMLNRPGSLCRGTGSSFARNGPDRAYPAPGATHLRTPPMRVVSWKRRYVPLAKPISRRRASRRCAGGPLSPTVRLSAGLSNELEDAWRLLGFAAITFDTARVELVRSFTSIRGL